MSVRHLEEQVAASSSNTAPTGSKLGHGPTSNASNPEATVYSGEPTHPKVEQSYPTPRDASGSAPTPLHCEPIQEWPKKGFFGLASHTAAWTHQSVGRDPYDYEKKYPEDALDEEMRPNARVWRTYLDESTRFDREMVEAYRDTTDVTLVFAGLFSAIVTTFVVQTSQSLQPDYAQILVSLVSEQIALQRAALDGTSAGNVPASPVNGNTPFVAAVSDKWVNGLWFMSLTISLTAALLAVLVKQWICIMKALCPVLPFNNSHASLSFHVIRDVACCDFHGVSFATTSDRPPAVFRRSHPLPFFWNLDIAMAAAVLGLAGAAYAFSICSNFLPLFYPRRPYQTPITVFALKLLRSIYSAFSPPSR